MRKGREDESDVFRPRGDGNTAYNAVHGRRGGHRGVAVNRAEWTGVLRRRRMVTLWRRGAFIVKIRVTDRKATQISGERRPGRAQGRGHELHVEAENGQASEDLAAQGLRGKAVASR